MGSALLLLALPYQPAFFCSRVKLIDDETRQVYGGKKEKRTKREAKNIPFLSSFLFLILVI